MSSAHENGPAAPPLTDEHAAEHVQTFPDLGSYIEDRAARYGLPDAEYANGLPPKRTRVPKHELEMIVSALGSIESKKVLDGEDTLVEFHDPLTGKEIDSAAVYDLLGVLEEDTKYYRERQVPPGHVSAAEYIDNIHTANQQAEERAAAEAAAATDDTNGTTGGAGNNVTAVDFGKHDHEKASEQDRTDDDDKEVIPSDDDSTANESDSGDNAKVINFDRRRKDGEAPKTKRSRRGGKKEDDVATEDTVGADTYGAASETDTSVPAEHGAAQAAAETEATADGADDADGNDSAEAGSGDDGTNAAAENDADSDADDTSEAAADGTDDNPDTDDGTSPDADDGTNHDADTDDKDKDDDKDDNASAAATTTTPATTATSTASSTSAPSTSPVTHTPPPPEFVEMAASGGTPTILQPHESETAAGSKVAAEADEGPRVVEPMNNHLLNGRRDPRSRFDVSRERSREEGLEWARQLHADFLRFADEWHQQNMDAIAAKGEERPTEVIPTQLFDDFNDEPELFTHKPSADGEHGVGDDDEDDGDEAETKVAEKETRRRRVRKSIGRLVAAVNFKRPLEGLPKPEFRKWSRKRWIAVGAIGIAAIAGDAGLHSLEHESASSVPAAVSTVQPGAEAAAPLAVNVAAPQERPAALDARTANTVATDEIVLKQPDHGQHDTVWAELQTKYGTNNHDTAELVAQARKLNPGDDLDRVVPGQHVKVSGR